MHSKKAKDEARLKRRMDATREAALAEKAANEAELNRLEAEGERIRNLAKEDDAQGKKLLIPLASVKQRKLLRRLEARRNPAN